MLSILALTYQGQMESAVKINRLKGSLEERRSTFFDSYIETMFKWSETNSPYSTQQTRHWLSWLARAMVRQDQTVFYLELIQPDWLSKMQAKLNLFVSILFIGLFSAPLLVLLIGLKHGLILAMAFGLIFGRWVGLPVRLVADELSTRSIPNEGIRRSLNDALRAGLFNWLIFGLIFGLIYELYTGLFFGLFFGVFGVIERGGKVCFQHGILRIFLRWYNYAPFRYVFFLEHAKDLLFLRRVGGGYIFVHRLLMEHFVGLEERSTKELNQTGQV